GEIDASWTSLKGTSSTDPNFGTTSPYTNKVRAMATGTARVGYASGAWLGYVKGGVAWADIQFSYAPGAPRPVVQYLNRTGLTGGAGVEYAFWRNVSAKLEYDAIYFGADSLSNGKEFNGPARMDHLFHV